MKQRLDLTQTEDIKVLQRDVQRWTERIGDVASGKLLEDVPVGTSSTAIIHGMGGRPRGRVIVYQSADARVWDAAKPDTTRLYLQASAATTVSLWVF